MKRTSSRARVGLLFFLGVIALTIGIFFIGEKSQLFSPVFHVRVNFTSIEGVKPGSNVLLAGYNVGTVSKLELTATGDSVRLTLRVEERVHPFIKHDSRAFIEQEGLVGNKYINLQIGSPSGVVVPDDGYIIGVDPFGLTSVMRDARDIIDTAKFISGRLKDIFVQLNRGEGTLGRLLVDESIFHNLEHVTARADTGLSFVTTQLGDLTTLLARLTTSVHRVVDRADSTVQNANLITSEVARFVTSVNEGKGTFGALLRERSLYDSLTGLLGSLQSVSLDASNAADQIARGMYGLRTHWLFGRVFGGPSIESEKAPVSSWQRRWNELLRRERELQKREAAIDNIERHLDSLDAAGAPARK